MRPPGAAARPGFSSLPAPAARLLGPLEAAAGLAGALLGRVDAALGPQAVAPARRFELGGMRIAVRRPVAREALVEDRAVEHVGVVRSLEKLGESGQAKSFDQVLELAQDWDRSRLRLVAFAQDKRSRRIVAS